MDAQDALDWLNSLYTIPSALLTSSLDDLRDCLCITDLIDNLQVGKHIFDI